MSFLYPLFLFAGVALAVPVLIHLFNLRRYKTVLFPHTRFLKNIQLNSRKQSKVRYKWLLAARLLFLTLLILAFAQPFLTRNSKKNAGNRLQVIYIDNSSSMAVKNGARSLLDVAKESGRRQLQHAVAGSRFLLLTNDKPFAYQPQQVDKALAELGQMDISPAGKSMNQVLAVVQSIIQSETADGADVYYYSDFQQTAVPAPPEKELMQHVALYNIPVQARDVQNIYIDTALLTTPVLQTGQSNQLVVRTKAIGATPKEAPVVQLAINGQVKSAASISFSGKAESIDTLSFQVNDAGWQRIEITVNDAAVRFDDTFRITARSAPGLNVLAVNEGQPNPYIQAAFRAYSGFRLSQADANSTPASWKEYNLVILNGVNSVSDALAKAIGAALQQGQSICIFPGRANNLTGLNDLLKQAGDIHISSLDTAVQTAGSLQQGSSLVKDLFEQIPDNVQLPVANWHYVINAGLSANQQSVLSFRNGDPFLARYMPGKGQLYICATSADLQSGNFPGSYFFVPFLYQMAMQSRSSDVYAITTGRQQPVYLSLSNATERNMVHVFGNGLDVIPPQHSSGAGVDVYVNQAVQQPAFYTLAAASGDTTIVALNQDRSESRLEYRDIKALKSQWAGDNIKWLGAGKPGEKGSDSEGSFPLWKVCVILALLMLAAETMLLADGLRFFRKQPAEA